MKKKISALLLFLLCAVMLFGTVSSVAVEPYQTYTYSIDGKALYSPAAYTPAMTVDYKYMGLANNFQSVDDLFVGPDNRVYLVDAGASSVYVLSPYYQIEKKSDGKDFVLNTFYNGTSQDKLNSPKGVFVNDECIYVCDTENYRIVVFDLDGNFLRIIPRPQSSLFGTDSTYKPVAMAVDQYGRLFVISSTTYQGVIVMTEDGTFTGFIGAQSVTYSIVDIIWRRFQTREQRENSVQYVSTEYNNITIDDDGFIYVTIQQQDLEKQQASLEAKDYEYAPVKKLNSSGSEIMKRNGFFGPGGDVDVQNSTTESGVPTGPSIIEDVAIGPEQTYSIIDTKRNKIFTYDQNGNLLFAFGDSGIQLGNTAKLNAITYQKYGDAGKDGTVKHKLLTLDSSTKMITVFTCTEYGNLLYSALNYENNRDYVNSVIAWKSVLARNNNFDAAYIGVGKAYYREGEYEQAMEYFKAAYDTENYSNAYSEVRKEWVSKYLIVIPIVVIVVLFALLKLGAYANKVNVATATKGGKRTFKEELLYSFHLKYHPFDGYWDLKHEKRGSVRAALVILVVTILCFYYQSVGTGYLLNPEGTYSTIWVQLIAVIIPLLLWVVANWCLTTLFDGEGSLKDVFVASCYSLAPLPLLLILSTALSNIVTSAEAQIVQFLIVLGYIWVGFLLFFGTMVTHDYSLGKNFITVIGTIVGMCIIMFVAVLFSSLLGKMISFVSNIIVEINYRL